jgi:hypothetical protein
MAAATQPIDTPERFGSVINHPVAAATSLFAGAMIALSATGFAVKASNTAGLKVVGRAEQSIDNSAGANGDLDITAKLGVFRYANSATAPIAAADVGKWAYVEDDTTVALNTTNKVKAGRIVAIDADGVWVDQRAFLSVPGADTITAAADLAALKTSLLALLQSQGLVV